MAQLANCKSPDCGRGVQRDTVTDDHGHVHPKVRVACATCGVAGDWQADDSLTRAIVAWNERHVPQANRHHDDRAAEARERELVAREQLRGRLEASVKHARAELAHCRLKEKDLRKAGDKENAATFAVAVKSYEDGIAGLETQLKELGASA